MGRPPGWLGATGGRHCDTARSGSTSYSAPPSEPPRQDATEPERAAAKLRRSWRPSLLRPRFPGGSSSPPPDGSPWRGGRRVASLKQQLMVSATGGGVAAPNHMSQAFVAHRTTLVAGSVPRMRSLDPRGTLCVRTRTRRGRPRPWGFSRGRQSHTGRRRPLPGASSISPMALRRHDRRMPRHPA